MARRHGAGAGSGMQNFVHSSDQRKSGNVSRPGSLEDLKVEVPKDRQAANIRQTRSHRTGAPQNRSQGVQAHAGRQPDNHQHIWNPDNSSIGDTSDTPGIRQIHQSQHAQNHPSVAAAQASQGQSDSQFPGIDFDEQIETDENPQDELPDVPRPDGMSDNAFRIMQNTDANRAKLVAEASLGYMKGDSYPASTSGPPSTYEPEDRKPIPVRQDRVSSQTSHRTQFQPSGPPPPQNQPQAQAQLRNGQQPPQHGQGAKSQISRPDAAGQATIQQQAEPAFSFAPTKANAGAKTAPINQRPREATDNRARQSLSTNTAQPATEPGHDLVAHQLPSLASAPIEHQLPRRQANADDPSMTKPYTTSGKPQRLPPPVVESPPIARPTQDDADMSDAQEHDEPKTSAEEEQLLYDASELNKVDFTDLKSQPFDVSPRHTPKVHPYVAPDDPIDKQVTTVAALHPQQQHDFMTSLPIDEWEQAGDWFLGKFGEILTELKKLRQSKRKAARAFENEVEARHVAVVRKRTLTESALDDMKMSGNMVLQGTPRKSKKTE